MTQVYKCDICGGMSEFEHNIMIGNKQDHFGDLCYDCIDLVKDFIKREHEDPLRKEPEPEHVNVGFTTLDMINALKSQGFVVYQKPQPVVKRVYQDPTAPEYSIPPTRKKKGKK